MVAAGSRRAAIHAHGHRHQEAPAGVPAHRGAVGVQQCQYQTWAARDAGAAARRTAWQPPALRPVPQARPAVRPKPPPCAPPPCAPRPRWLRSRRNSRLPVTTVTPSWPRPPGRAACSPVHPTCPAPAPTRSTDGPASRALGSMTRWSVPRASSAASTNAPALPRLRSSRRRRPPFAADCRQASEALPGQPAAPSWQFGDRQARFGLPLLGAATSGCCPSGMAMPPVRDSRRMRPAPRRLAGHPGATDLGDPVTAGAGFRLPWPAALPAAATAQPVGAKPPLAT